MKKSKLILTIFMSGLLVTSCSDSHVDDGCHGCHLEATIIEVHCELDPVTGDTINCETHEELEIWEITNSTGGVEFCGDDLLNVEAPDYVHTITEPLIGEFHGATLPAGSYGPGVDSIYVVHCEDHPDDDHDH